MRRIALFVCVLCLAESLCSAQTARRPTPAPKRKSLTLSEAVSLFLRENLFLVAARFDVETAEAEKLSARLRPNPEFSLEAEDLPTDFGGKFFQQQEIAPVLGYTLELGGKRRKRMDSAGAHAKVAEAEFEATMWQLTNDFKRKFFRLVLAQSKRELAEANQKTFADILEDNRQRFQLGEISGLDLRRLEMEKLKFDIDVANARGDFQLALRDLRLALGGDYRRMDFAVEGKLDDRPYQFSLSELERKALEARPDLRAGRRREAAADADIRLQRALRIPDLTLEWGYKRNGPDNTYDFGGGISLPIFDRNQGERAKALIQKRRARNEERIVTNNILSDVDKALALFEIQKERVETYRSGVLSRLDEIQKLTEDSYQAGEASVLDLLDAVRTRRETQSGYYDTLFDYQMSLLDLELATATTLVK
ncbi:MAG: TolC family protein [Acidobacteriota bacterium]